jgi:hypothetical protein
MDPSHQLAFGQNADAHNAAWNQRPALEMVHPLAAWEITVPCSDFLFLLFCFSVFNKPHRAYPSDLGVVVIAMMVIILGGLGRIEKFGAGPHDELEYHAAAAANPASAAAAATATATPASYFAQRQSSAQSLPASNDASTGGAAAIFRPDHPRSSIATAAPPRRAAKRQRRR